MYKKLLIANRADCAVRLIRSCHNLGIETVLIAARDEPASLALTQSDAVFYTGMSRDAYLNEDNMIDVARESGCEAILPGWGFLSESYRFARRVRLAGLDFIGPRESHMQIFGDKLATLDAFVPILRTDNIYASTQNDIETLISQDNLHSAWMLKGRYGGGGKAVHVYHRVDELRTQIERISAMREMQDYYVEKAICQSRHIELQLFGCGSLGTKIVGIRDCTHQKNQQKWLEFHIEATSIDGLTDLSRRVADSFSAIEFEGWATVEFLCDADKSFHLLEVNPRLQVEHGVTEMARHIDLVELGLRYQCDRRCDPRLSEASNHNPVALEFRLYAQSAGKLDFLGFDGDDWPDHPQSKNADYRIETGYVAGDEITGVYDGCLARFLVRANAGDEALAKMKLWLRSFRCEGVESNLSALFDLKSL